MEHCLFPVATSHGFPDYEDYSSDTRVVPLREGDAPTLPITTANGFLNIAYRNVVQMTLQFAFVVVMRKSSN